MEILDQPHTIGGYPVNYFKDLKNLKIGDQIIYTKDDNKKIYEVEILTIIEEVDWSYLESTKENKITLITCVENQPQLRRCIQAKQIE